MTIGIIFTSFGMEEYLSFSLTPWVEIRRTQVGGHQYLICAVSVPFEGFEAGPADGTVDRLERLRLHNHIDAVITSNTPIKETTARGDAMNWLIAHGADTIWQWDGDEMTQPTDIERIVRFVDSRSLVSWFRVSYRNAVFTKDQYLIEPFCPPRIHRVRPAGLTAHSFWDDNNVLYRDGSDAEVRDVNLSSLTIPAIIAHPRHFTWLSDERSKRKISYQHKRWGHSSFRWDERHGLCFDESYYTAKGLPLPEVAHD